MKPSELLNTIPKDELLAILLANQVPVVGGCIRWTGTISTPGYGLLPFRGKRVHAHRAAWVVKNGPLDPQLDACHTCDNRWCVNPDHIFPGTRRENMLDCSRKQRLHAQVSPETIARREGHGSAKLTEEDVAKARNLYATGAYTKTALASIFNVHRSTMTDALVGKTWPPSAP